jgi:hypothetical protein
MPLKKNSDGSLSLAFAPKQSGHYFVQLVCDGKSLFADPYAVDVAAPVVIQQPSRLPRVIADGSVQPFALVFLDHVPADDLAVEIRDKNNGRVVDTIKVMKRADGNVELAYAPKVPGKYSATLMNGAVPIDETIKFEFEVLPGDTPMEARLPRAVIHVSNDPVQFGQINIRFDCDFDVFYLFIFFSCFVIFVVFAVSNVLVVSLTTRNSNWLLWIRMGARSHVRFSNATRTIATAMSASPSCRNSPAFIARNCFARTRRYLRIRRPLPCT